MARTAKEVARKQGIWKLSPVKQRKKDLRKIFSKRGAIMGGDNPNDVQLRQEERLAKGKFQERECWSIPRRKGLETCRTAETGKGECTADNSTEDSRFAGRPYCK